MADFIIIGILGICVFTVGYFFVKRKKSGKSCGCQCGGCSHTCHKK